MTNFQDLQSLADFQSLIENKPASLIYFSHESCNVCKVLKPKVAELIEEEFPNITLAYVDVHQHPEISGQLQLFTVPTLLVYFDGKEYIRKSRHIGIDELAREISRPYELMF